MKKMLSKYGSFFAAFALVVTTYTANSACMFIMHQDELPAGAKSLRKF